MSDTTITIRGVDSSKVKNETTLPASKKKCRIEFKLSDMKLLSDGNVGYDSYYDIKSYVEASFKDEVKRRYTTYPDIAGEEYVTPWFCIRSGQEVVIKINSTIKGKYDQIKLDDESRTFTFTPNVIDSKTKEIKVKCNSEFIQDKVIEVKADGELAGALAFASNKPKVVKLKWVVVVLNSKDKVEVGERINNEYLQKYLKSAFNSMATDIKLVNTEAEVLDLMNLNNDTERAMASKLRSYMQSSNSVDVNDITKKMNFFNSIANLYNNKISEMEDDCIYLFLTNIKSQDTGGEKESFNGGISATGENRALMFLANEFTNPKKEIPHEIMHCLSLGHTFPEYIQSSTINYMDYHPKEAQPRYCITWKWQLDRIRKSKFCK